MDFGTSIGSFVYSDVTIEFWMKTSASNPEFILGKRPVCGYDSFWDILVNQNGVIQAELCEYNTGYNYELITGQHIVNDGVFHHVAMVRQGVNFLVYVDGALDGASSTLDGVLLYNTAHTTAGVTPCTGTSNSRYYQGLLDDITLYSRAAALLSRRTSPLNFPRRAGAASIALEDAHEHTPSSSVWLQRQKPHCRRPPAGWRPLPGPWPAAQRPAD
jgi:hypothetical protein